MNDATWDCRVRGRLQKQGGGGAEKSNKKLGEQKIKDFVGNQIFTRGQKAFFSNFREKLFFFSFEVN